MAVYTWTGLGAREDAIASGRLAAQIDLNIPGLESLSMSAKRDAALAELCAELGGVASFTSLSLSGDPGLTLGAAASRIVPGATSFAVRDTANAQNNLLVLDSGAVTARLSLTTPAVVISTGSLTFGAAAGVLIPGATSFSLRNTANTQDNLIVLDNGNTTVRGTLTATGGFVLGAASVTQLTISTAISKIIPGATSLSLRNNADSADNLIITDAGVVTLRSTLQVPGLVTLDAGIAIKFTSASGAVQSGATAWRVIDSTGSFNNLLVNSNGDTTVRGIFTVTGGLAAGTVANNGLTVALGSLTVTAGNISITAGQLNLDNAQGAIRAGATNFRVINNAGSQNNLVLTDAGAATFRASVESPIVTVTVDNSLLFTSQTSAAAAQVGTLTNAPTAGNPAGFLRVKVNGTNSFIPYWQ